MQINPLHIKVETFSTGTAWFRNDNGVRVTHIPTGIAAESTTERSAHANRHKAFEALINLINLGSDYSKQLEMDF